MQQQRPAAGRHPVQERAQDGQLRLATDDCFDALHPGHAGGGASGDTQGLSAFDRRAKHTSPITRTRFGDAPRASRGTVRSARHPAGESRAATARLILAVSAYPPPRCAGGKRTLLSPSRSATSSSPTGRLDDRPATRPGATHAVPLHLRAPERPHGHTTGVAAWEGSFFDENATFAVRSARSGELPPRGNGSLDLYLAFGDERCDPSDGCAVRSGRRRPAEFALAGATG